MSGALSAMIAAAFAGGGAPPVVSDPYFEYTTLLLPGNGTNGAQNNTFLDSSTNNFTITRNGNTTQGTFSPFSQTGWGVYFDGNNDNCTSSTALFNYTTGNASTQTATVETWVYLNAYAVGTLEASNPSIAAKGSTYMNFGINPSGNLELYWYDGATKSITSSGTVPLNTWVYVAFTLSGGTATLYINGNSSGSGSWTGLHSGGINSTSYFGNTTSGPTTGINGYLSNLRVSTTARSIITPTSAFSNDGNTAFLSFQSNRFVDNSSNTYAITPSGNTSVQAFSPFNPSASWSAATYGGSGYFDGTGDYLNTASDAAFTLGSSGDFTVELFFYAPSSQATNAFLVTTEADNNTDFLNRWAIQFGTSTAIAWMKSTGSTGILSSTVTFGQWNHLAVCRSGSTITMWLNGVSQGTQTTDQAYTTQGSVKIGYVSGAAYFNGYISNVRVVKGTAVYTANFTPPTAPLTAITNTSLLLNYTNAGIYDATSKNDLETVGDAQISTAQSKWGGSSMYFDETGDYLTLPASQNVALGSGDFTIECWARFAASTVGNGMGLFQLSSGYLNSQVRGPAAGADNTTGRWSIYYGTSSTVHASLAPSTNTWYHVAFVRASGTSKLYVDGTEIISVSDSTNYTGTYFTVGGWYSSSFLLNGYLQDVRITKYARYTTNFTAPTAAFPTL